MPFHSNTDRYMEPHIYYENEKPLMMRYNRVRKLWQMIMELVGIFVMISWSWSRVFDVACALSLKLYGFVFSHHFVFLIGNAIVVVLYVLCRRSSTDDGVVVGSVDGGDFFRDESSFSLAGDDVAALDGSVSVSDDVALARPVARKADVALAVPRPPCDDVAEAVDRASRQIRRFERTQSERLRREIAPPPRPAKEMRRSSTEMKSPVPEIESLDGEEFRRAIEAFIEENWSRSGARKKNNEFEKYQLVKVT